MDDKVEPEEQEIILSLMHQNFSLTTEQTTSLLGLAEQQRKQATDYFQFTSLINKEEVFKMLALAEASGLPLLLVGDPGVAKTKTIIEYAKAWLNKDGKMTAQDFANKMYVLEKLTKAPKLQKSKVCQILVDYLQRTSMKSMHLLQMQKSL